MSQENFENVTGTHFTARVPSPRIFNLTTNSTHVSQCGDSQLVELNSPKKKSKLSSRDEKDEMGHKLLKEIHKVKR